ncbi:MAG TPA: hypothetical protein DCS07_10940 [Bdellovibrionales bacterium]|nr:MAG: hypothetical protein A2Z97_02265 [Bdellovibrionales bacterium GWB1_52_6]OFZ04088.1 MAG: hypothetical protein A2X97_14905 [Bdellovibrionales bacterium GWA1_52_35]OFZ41221.1 MAG: hypothetical protein A2070_03830 [Bdellovibrionales bacterium GWC1_52_8]HAR43124.1 hypothetical protein [Bdellovibrionales bacterium]HCM39825.1 hypothetical protein [Bdellovibrionales bacterium]
MAPRFPAVASALLLSFLSSITATAQSPCVNALSDALKTTPVAKLAPGLLPRKGPPVLIGILAETPDGKPLLVLGQQISDGHAGLLASVRKQTGQDIRKISWAGELLFEKRTGQIIAANETAGILARSSEELGIPFTVEKTGARVENLISYLNRPEKRALKSPTMRAEKFHVNRPVSHFDPNAQVYSDFRHEVGTFGIHLKLKSRQLLKLTEVQGTERQEILKFIADQGAQAQIMIREIERQRGLRFAELAPALPLLKRIQAREVLTKDQYDIVIRTVEQFFRNYEAPRQIF